VSDHDPQNVYDDPRFFAGYSGMERFGAGWTKAVEQPHFLSLLPDLGGRRVLDLGCGAGQLARHIAEGGAAEIIAMDVSERMLAIAREQFAHPRVTHRWQAIEEADFPAGRFDLVVSSLALHYVADYAGLMRRIAAWLTPTGVLVFSTEHPVYTARAEDDELKLERYSDEGLRERTWFVEGVRRYHRTLATLVNGLIDAGLAVERVLEPVSAAPDAVDRDRPWFILFRARKG
jgi:2-polyprenyl-3-methyl-5-hydroxy-6-metoxy-1,4-benzoquinol methylase